MTQPVRLHAIVTPEGAGSVLYLDGHKLNNVRSFNLIVGGGKSSTLIVEIANVEAELEGAVADACQVRA